MLIVYLASLSAIIAFFVAISGNVFAANLTDISVTLSRLKISESANQTIEFVTPTGVNAAGETIIITYDGGSTAFGLSDVTYADIDLKIDTSGACSSFTDKTLASSAASGVWGVNVDNGNGAITFTAPTDATTDEIEGGSCVKVLIGSHASGGTNVPTNPSSTGAYFVAITGTFGDEGISVVRIITDDQVEITASIAPTLEVAISSNTCALGTLSSTYIETCSYDVTVSTNASTGYVSTILADGLLRNSSDSITNAAGGTVVRGSEGYGIGTSLAGQTIVQNADCTDGDTSASQPASALTTSAQQFASASGPVASDVATVCHLASVSGTSAAGIYAQTATVVVTAGF
jgi:hypothetical protein